MSKCKVCNKGDDWIYKDEIYCENHVPCGRFKKFVGKYIMPIFIGLINKKTEHGKGNNQIR